MSDFMKVRDKHFHKISNLVSQFQSSLETDRLQMLLGDTQLQLSSITFMFLHVFIHSVISAFITLFILFSSPSASGWRCAAAAPAWQMREEHTSRDVTVGLKWRTPPYLLSDYLFITLYSGLDRSRFVTFIVLRCEFAIYWCWCLHVLFINASLS